MSGFFGVVSKKDCVMDLFFGVDYHSHLGTRRGGMAAYDKEIGLQRTIHNIENAPFRTKFEHIFDEMQGTSAIGCISDTDPQPCTDFFLENGECNKRGCHDLKIVEQRRARGRRIAQPEQQAYGRGDIQ